MTSLRSICLLLGLVVSVYVDGTRRLRAAEGVLAAARLVRIAQSSAAAATNAASRAVDGNTNTFSLTADLAGSFWTAELGRPYALRRIEILNRAGAGEAELTGQTLRLFNLDDQLVFETTLLSPGPSAIRVVPLPDGLLARSIWIGLPGSQTNGAGNFRVGFSEVRLFGVLDLPYGPVSVAPTNAARVWQSSEYPGFPAGNAVDGNTRNFSHTGNESDSFWMADFGRAVTVNRIEIVNRLDCCANRLTGLVARLYDAGSNNVWSATLTNVGLGGLWTRLPPAGTSARWLRVGLENG